MLPAVKARMRKRSRRNIGSATRSLDDAEDASRASPPTSTAITIGFVQPMVWPP